MSKRHTQWEPLDDREVYPQTGRRLWATLAQGFALGLLVIGFMILVAIAGLEAVYAYYARELPSPQELNERTLSFKTCKIYDRDGRLLYEVIDPHGGRREIVPYEQFPDVLIDAVVAPEDATFYSNQGVSPKAIARALYQNLRYGEIQQGGSTITQQLVKNVFLSEERTLDRKIKEAILALEISRHYSKSEILEAYLNEVYFGNLSYGIGAAAETYFAKDVSELDLAEAALLAGLLQSPAGYDPYRYPEAAEVRRNDILGLMLSREAISLDQYHEALQAPIEVQPLHFDMQAPHMVMYVLKEELEPRYGQGLYTRGLRVYTTLDLDLQREAQRIASEKTTVLRERGASNAALVAIEPSTGQILAMLGSLDYDDEAIDGNVNVVTRLRSPGSLPKAITYLTAFEQGWSPATMVMDLEQDFPGWPEGVRLHNYDDKEFGPMSLREALACSRNIPAVATLQQVGERAFCETAQRLGVASFDVDESEPSATMDGKEAIVLDETAQPLGADSSDDDGLGLSITIGGKEASLLELTGAYAVLANEGLLRSPQTILRIEDDAGNLVWEPEKTRGERVVDVRQAYLLTDVLADDEARIRAFGPNNSLDLPYPAAAKTGTSQEYKDSWTIGYTPRLAVGVWVGNSSGASMNRVSGSQGAGLIWHDFMLSALGEGPQPGFSRPDGIVEVQVCPVSGMAHTDLCPEAETELFLVENQPQPCNVHRKVAVCTISGKLAGEHCPAEAVEMRLYTDYGPEWDAWAREQGLETPPREECPLHDSPTEVGIDAPSATETGIIVVRGVTQMPDFASYRVEWGKGNNPSDWHRITPEITAPVSDGILCQWDARSMVSGDYVLRVIVSDRHGLEAEARATIRLTAPSTATPLPSATMPPPTRTVQPTGTLRPTGTIQPTPTWTLASLSPSATVTTTATAWPTEPITSTLPMTVTGGD